MDLTRRGLLGRAAAASGALVAGSLLAPRPVFAGQHGETVFELRVPRGGGPVEAPRTFELLGVRTDGHATQIDARARGLDGRWSEWLPLHPGHDNSALSDPVWTGPARAFELRSKRPLAGARVVLVGSGGTAATAAGKRLVAIGLDAGPGEPDVIARSSWATAACRPRVSAVFGSMELAFVHHTVSSNAYRPSQSAQMVRSICLFHKYGNGWNDIGYNFVVDRYGQIFEARAGGIDETIVGAQAGGYNVYSTGVALLGNFGGSGPPRPAFDALSRLLAWKLALHGVEATGKVTVEVTRTGAPYSRYRAGARVRLNRIAGHRDADATTCPGAGMYRQLPRLRQVVKGLAGTVGSLTLQSQGSGPGVVTVGGTLTAGGAPMAGVEIEVQRRSVAHEAETIVTAITDGNGAWSAPVQLAGNTQLRALYRGTPAVVSAGLSATAAPQIALTAATQQAAPGSVIEFTGTVVPTKPKLSIVISQQQPDGTFATTRTIKLSPADDGSFRRSIGFAAAGQYQVIAHTAADQANALGTSPPVAITIA